VPALSNEQVRQLIPHREPFLWIDNVREFDERRIVAQKLVEHSNEVFRGHYPGYPVLPGVILCEMAMQAGALLIAARAQDPLPEGQIPVVTRMNKVKFRRMVRPGDLVVIEASLDDAAGGVYFLSGRLSVEQLLVAQLEFACAITAG
jgi:3-hydroxyacyl-[acyl-carrier-protein] dehydratase